MQLLKDKPQRQIVCPGCDEVRTLPEQLQESRQIIKKLQSLDQLAIICTEHQPKICLMFCSNCEIPVCKECKNGSHKDHLLVDLTQKQINDYAQNVRNLFQEYSVQNMISQVEKLCEKQEEVTSYEFKTICSKINRMLSHLTTDEEFNKIDLVSCFGVHQNIPKENQLKAIPINPISERINQEQLTRKDIQDMINNSQDLLRKEFKQTLAAFERNQIQNDKSFSEQIDLKIQSDIQSSISKQLQQFKQAGNTDLEKQRSDFEIESKEINLKLNYLYTNFTQLDQALHKATDNFESKLKTLNDQLIEFNQKIDTVKQLTQNKVNDLSNQVMQSKELRLDSLKSQFSLDELNHKLNNLQADLSIVSSIVYNSLIAIEGKYNLQQIYDEDSDPNDADDSDDDNLKPLKQQLVDQEIKQTNSSLLCPQLIRELLLYENLKFDLLFKGTTDGFSASKFHELCDSKWPTVSFILSENGQVFGGYTSLSWASPPNEYDKILVDSTAFLFNLNKRSIHKQLRNQIRAICHDKNCLCVFGHDGDIEIKDDCDKGYYSYSNLGSIYELNNGIKFESIEARSYLAGQFGFKVLEIEVYSLRNC
eukprot:403371507